MAGGCMLLGGMELTSLAANRGQAAGGGSPMAAVGMFAGTEDIQEGISCHMEEADIVQGLEMLAEEGHTHTAEEHESWTAWDDNALLPTSAGNYYLTVDVTLTALWTVPSGQAVNLCLNGHTIQQTKASTGVAKVNGAGTELSVYDCSEGTTGMITGGKGSGSNGGGITVSSGGALNLYGGKISGNTAASGGGIYVTGGSAALYGGAVTGNSATGNGGGIYLAASGSLTINGGSIENNKTTGTSGKGGGVHVASGAAEMYGGEITGNESPNGGGVYTVGSGSSFAISGGSITGNTVTTGGGGIYIATSSKVTVNGGTIGSNTVTGTTGKGGGIYVASGTADIYGGAITGNQAVSGGGIFATSTSSNVNLNGGSVTGNTATGDGGGIHAASSSKLTINGGSISANTASNKGGGIYYASSFTVNGGAIYANKVGEAVNNLQVSSATSSYKAALNGGLILGGLMEAEKFYVYGSDMHSGSISGTIGNEISSKKGAAEAAVLSGAQIGDVLYASTAEEITSTADGRLYKAVYLSAEGEDGTGTWEFRWVPEIGTEFTVTYHTNGGTIENEENYTKYRYGTELPLPAAHEIIRSGYEFLGWYDNEGFTGSPVTSIAADALFEDTPVFYAKWREGHACADCPAEHTAIGNWVPWEDSTKLPEAADIPESTGSYYLTVDIELTTAAWSVPKGKAINLCLNGHTIRQGKEGAGVISIIGTGTELAVFDCSAGMTGMITGGMSTSTTAGGGITVGSTSGSGSLKLYGGKISGNEAPNGGGIYVTGSGSTLVIDGGTIESNTATGTSTSSGRGGGICAANGTVTLSGGIVTQNKANYGGGVSVSGGSTVMSGIEVTGNTANQGGGAYTTGTSASFTMNNGTIADNTTTGNGGGLHAASSSNPIINGGTISGNNATGNGGGIYGATTKLAINGGTITGNGAGDGGGIFYTGSFTVSGGAIYANMAGEAVNNLSATSASATASLKGGLILGGLEGKGKYSHSSDECPMYPGEITGTIGNEITSRKGEAVTAVLSGAQEGNVLYASTAEAITSEADDGRTYKGIYLPSAEENGTWSFRWMPDGETKFQITYETNGGTIQNLENYAEYTFGTELLLPTAQDIIRQGHEFLGWYEEADFTGDPVTSIASDALFEGEPVYYAKWREGHLCADCPQEHDAVTDWTPWEDSTKLPDSAGSYYLAVDVNLEGIWAVTKGTTVNLCLNGHTIRQTNASAGVISVIGTGTELSVFDCSAGMAGMITGGKSTATSTGGGITIGSSSGSGSLNLYGGRISGNAAVNGGGIYIANNGSKLLVDGGVIENNTVTGTTSTSGRGGGLYVSGGTVTLSDGEIRGNQAKDGGGAYTTGSSSYFNLNGGRISGNTATGDGGGMYVASSSKPTITGGTITGNKADGNGGGIYVASGTAAVSGGEITNNEAVGGGGAYIAGGTVTMSDGGIADNRAANGGGVYTTGSTGKFILDNGSITGNTATGNGGGIYAVSSSTATVNNGSISGNNAAGNGGGIYTETTKLTVTGGTISGNKADSNGGGIYYAASFTVSGGAIYTNMAGGAANNLDGSAASKIASLKGGLILGGLGENGKVNYNSSANPMYSGVVAGTLGDTVTNGTDTIPGVKAGDTLIASRAEGITIESVSDGQSYIAVYTDSGEGIWQFQLPSSSPEPSPEPTASPSPEPTASPTPEPTASPSPEPTASPTPEPTASPSPEPTASPTPEPTASPSPEPTASPTPEPTASPTPEPTPSPTPTASSTPTLSPEPGTSPEPSPGASPEITPIPEWNTNGGQQGVEGDMWVRQPVIEVELPGNLNFGINPFKLPVNGGGEDNVPVTDQIISGEYYVTNYSNVAVAVTAATFVSAANDDVELVTRDDVVWNTADELEPSALAGKKAVWLVQLYPTDIRVDETGNSMIVTGITEGVTTGVDAAGDTLIKGEAVDVVKKPIFVLAAWDELGNNTKKASMAGFRFGGAVDSGAAFEDGDITVTTVFELRILTAEQAEKNYEGYKTLDGVTGFHSTIRQEKEMVNP